MAFLGCYCGCATISNRVRWVGVALLFIAGLGAFVAAAIELAACRKPCPGDSKDAAQRVRQDGVNVYVCTSNPSKFSCSRDTISDRFWLGVFLWGVAIALGLTMLCCSPRPPRAPLSRHGSLNVPGRTMELATVHETPAAELSHDSVLVPVSSSPNAAADPSPNATGLDDDASDDRMRVAYEAVGKAGAGAGK